MQKQDDDGELLPVDPTARMQQPCGPSERERFLKPHEIRLFWRACNDEGYPHGRRYQLQLLTAARPSEVLRLPFLELDMVARKWELPLDRDNKSERAHIIHISDLAAEIIEDIGRRSRSPKFLFTYDGIHPMSKSPHGYHGIAKRMQTYHRNDITNSSSRYGGEAIPPCEPRDLRRTAATIMAELGHPIEVVDKILNHAGGRSGTGRTVNSVARIYIKHEFSEERRKALQDLGEYIRELVEE